MTQTLHIILEVLSLLTCKQSKNNSLYLHLYSNLLRISRFFVLVHNTGCNESISEVLKEKQKKNVLHINRINNYKQSKTKFLPRRCSKKSSL